MNTIVKKRDLGQFFTTNSDYILQGLNQFVKNKEITDPFAGNQDLLRWAKLNNCKKIIGFDCDQKYVDGKNVLLNDSINYPKNYKFVCIPILRICTKTKLLKKLRINFFAAKIQVLKTYIKFLFYPF